MEQEQPAEVNELEDEEDIIGPGQEPRVSDIQPKCVHQTVPMDTPGAPMDCAV